MKFILGKKIGMTQVFLEDGRVAPVTLVEAGPCVITQIKTKETDGYNAVQIGFDKLKEKQVKKPQTDKPFRFMTEFRIDNPSDFELGQEITIADFQVDEKAKISGKSKGKGFQGVIKRHGFSGQPRTHGVKHERRKGGSIGSAFPQRVFKGKKMPGRMGFDRITVKNLRIIQVNPEENLIAFKGALPGRKGTVLEIKVL